MKKTIALVLCLLMVVSLAACGGQATADESSASAEQTETAEPTTEETTQQEESSEPVETEPAFDTSWASNDFEKLIPQPPFEGWSGEKTSDNIYKMETSQANADGSGTYYDTWAVYIQTLNDCGFVVKGDTYNSEGTDSNGNKVELQCGDGHAWITIYTAMTDQAFDTSWAGDEYVMPIPEPPFAYEVNVDGTAVEIRSTNGGKDGDVTHQSILDYCEELKNAGFTLNLTENEIGERYGRTCYEFSASDAAGNNVNLIDDGGEVIIFASLTKTSSETNTEENNVKEESEDTILKFGNAMLPDLEWTCEETEEPNGNKYLIYETENAPQNVIEDFVEQLKVAGYTLYEESVDEDGNWYFWGISNDVTEGSANINFSSKYSTCQIYIFGDF